MSILAFFNDSVTKKVAAEGRSIPSWFSHGMGMFFISTLVWHGWFFTAIAFLISELIEYAIFYPEKV
jgi:hypothetical protein